MMWSTAQLNRVSGAAEFVEASVKAIQFKHEPRQNSLILQRDGFFTLNC